VRVPLLFALVASPLLLGLTAPISGAVAFPSDVTLHLPFPAGANIRISSGFSPQGGSSLHGDTDATSKANDYYALDLVYSDEPSGGLGLPVVAPLPGTVVKAGWATSGWANYGQRVILAHDLGDGHVYHSLYAHLNAIDESIVAGATVDAGQVLGELGRSCQGALSCGSFSGPHLHWVIHRDSSVGGSGTGGSYGGNAVVPEPLDGTEDLSQGLVITSTNSLDPVCGDGFCSTGEEGGVCPGDCPVCEPIPAAGGVIDDDSACFTPGGNPTYWNVASEGYDGALRWTHTTSSDTVDNHGIWALDLVAAGDYLVEVYAAPGYAESELATYVVRHGGETTAVTFDQSAHDGFATLGTFAFAAGGDQSIRLNDNSGEPFSDMTRIAFDAIRLSPAADAPDAGPSDAGPADPIPDSGPDADDAGAVGDAGGGGSTQDAGGDDDAGSQPPGGGGVSADPAGDSTPSGCGGCAGSPPSLFGWLAGAGLLARRRRRTATRRP